MNVFTEVFGKGNRKMMSDSLQLAVSKDGTSLLLTNEKKKSYSVLLTDRSITAHP
ncbi:MAG: hypothetical protein V4532_04440 [Pseudomonadota bacterium]